MEFVLGGTYLAVFWFFSCSDLAAAVLNDLARNRAYDAAIGDAILQVALMRSVPRHSKREILWMFPALLLNASQREFR